MYDNVGDKQGRSDEATYDNRPEKLADDYMEGCLKQNIYDNNIRDEIPGRSEDEKLYDNRLTQNDPLIQDKFGSHPYDNVSKLDEVAEENVYESGDPVYDNKSGERNDRHLSACIYDNNLSDKIPNDNPYTNCVDENNPGFRESAYDNASELSGRAVMHGDDDGNYARMESVRRTETGTHLSPYLVLFSHPLIQLLQYLG